MVESVLNQVLKPQITEYLGLTGMSARKNGGLPERRFPLTFFIGITHIDSFSHDFDLICCLNWS